MNINYDILTTSIKKLEEKKGFVNFLQIVNNELANMFKNMDSNTNIYYTSVTSSNIYKKFEVLIDTLRTNDKFNWVNPENKEKLFKFFEFYKQFYNELENKTSYKSIVTLRGCIDQLEEAFNCLDHNTIY